MSAFISKNKTKRISETNGKKDAETRARALGLWGLVNSWEKLKKEPWIEELLDLEEGERHQRSLNRRMKASHIGRFNPMADFDWNWPSKINRDVVEDALRLTFLNEGANVILIGQNGVGKTMIAQNIAHQAVLAGQTVRMITASELLYDLGTQESTTAVLRRVRRYVNPSLLVIDELGYLASTARHADLLFEVVKRRYDEKRSIIITTNKSFKEWTDVFPTAACVGTMVDRLVHCSEIIRIEGNSFRLHQAKERQRRKNASDVGQDDLSLGQEPR